MTQKPDAKAKLAKHLERTGESQRQFAAKIGSKQSIVSRILCGQVTPSLTIAARIERVARIPASSWVDTQ